MADVKIVPSVLKQQVEEGWKLKPLAEHYGLPVTQMKKALQALNLTIRKFHLPKFEFVNEDQEEVQVIEDINDTVVSGVEIVAVQEPVVDEVPTQSTVEPVIARADTGW